MKRLLALLALLPALAANGAQIWTVNSVADPADPLPLVWLNANTINTNVFAAYGTSWGDNAGGLWTFKKADATATNTVALGGPVESVNPLSPAGRWFKLIPLNTGAPVTASTNYWLLSVTGGVTNLQPSTLPGWQPMVPYLSVGSNTPAIYGALTGDGIVLIHSPDRSDSNYNNVYLQTYSTNGAGTIELSTTTNQAQISMVVSTNTFSVLNTPGTDFNLQMTLGGAPVIKLNALPNATTPAAIFDTIIAHTGGDLVEIANNGTNQVTFGPLAQIGFGPGTTNVLYKGTDSLIFTNASVNGAFLDVVNTNGVKTRFGTSLGGSAEVIAGAGHSIFFGPDNNAGGGTALLSTQGFVPVTSGGAGLGNSAQLWAGAWLTNAAGTGTNYIFFGTNTLSVQGSDLYWNQTKLN